MKLLLAAEHALVNDEPLETVAETQNDEEEQAIMGSQVCLTPTTVTQVANLDAT